VLAAAHEIDQRPVEERLKEVVGRAAAPGVVPDVLAVRAGEVIEKGLHRLIDGVQHAAFPHGPGRQRRYRDISSNGIQQNSP
jgi:hypothetical protein